MTASFLAMLTAAALPVAVRADPAAPAEGRFEGILTALWGDPGPGSASGGGMIFTLVFSDGARAAVEAPAALRNRALQLNGKRVIVRGEAAKTGASQSVIKARAIEPAPATR